MRETRDRRHIRYVPPPVCGHAITEKRYRTFSCSVLCRPQMQTLQGYCLASADRNRLTPGDAIGAAWICGRSIRAKCPGSIVIPKPVEGGGHAHNRTKRQRSWRALRAGMLPAGQNDDNGAGRPNYCRLALSHTDGAAMERLPVVDRGPWSAGHGPLNVESPRERKVNRARFSGEPARQYFTAPMNRPAGTLR